MSYAKRILVLQESLKLLDNRIKGIEKGLDKNLLSEAISQKVTLEREISRLQKLHWEEKHERVNLDDDR